jgi:DNA-binding response OmpR family regulator
MKILVIEDSRATSDFIKHGLEEEGFAVDTAFTGEEGLELAQTFDYGLVLLDVMLPGKNGFEVCESLRQFKAHIPILMLTGKIEVADRVHGLNSGADDYLMKPFSFGELVARIHALTRRAKQPVHAELTAGLLIMDTGARKVTFDGLNIELTNKEYAILELLMINRNMVVTRTTLEQQIWNQEFDGASNMIDVYIRRLRSKIGNDGEGLIQTVRGTGYRLVVP